MRGSGKVGDETAGTDAAAGLVAVACVAYITILHTEKAGVARDACYLVVGKRNDAAFFIHNLHDNGGGGKLAGTQGVRTSCSL